MAANLLLLSVMVATQRQSSIALRLVQLWYSSVRVSVRIEGYNFMHNSMNRIAVCSWSLQPADTADLIARLDSTGIHAVSLALSPLIEQPKNWADAVLRLRDAGIDVISGMMATQGEDYSTLQRIAETGGLRPSATWPANLEHAKAVAALAAAHEIELVTFHAGFLPEETSDPERAVLLDRLGQVADVFAASGLRIALETGQESAATLSALLAELNRPNIGVNFDPANMILYAMGDPAQAIMHLKPFVLQIHIKDALATKIPGTWGEEVPVGQGQVQWAALLEVVRSITPAIDLVIEREAGDHRVADIITARDLLASYGFTMR
jgi:L-ribulose-5-phosphate 3-epimerase